MQDVTVVVDAAPKVTEPVISNWDFFSQLLHPSQVMHGLACEYRSKAHDETMYGWFSDIKRPGSGVLSHRRG